MILYQTDNNVTNNIEWFKSQAVTNNRILLVNNKQGHFNKHIMK